MRTIHQLVQGSPEWLAHRATPGIVNGSVIYAMLGIAGYTTYSELLREAATGIKPEIDAATQRRFDDGHANEALALPLAESIIDDDLSAMVMSDVIDGVHISVSLDGITQGYDTTFEHKSLNKNLEAALDTGTIPEMYHPQMEAGLMVSGATRCLFMASRNGDMETARHAWYESNPALRPRIIAACKQFAEDVANYQHVEVIPAAVAEPVIGLPAVFVQVEGRVVAGDMRAHREKVTAWVKKLPSKFDSDQDFADGIAAVKACEKAEEDLSALHQQVLGQMVSVDEVIRLINEAKAEIATARIRIDKSVKAEKENRKAGIVTTAQNALHEHYKALNARIGGNWMPPLNAVQFADAIKGLKSLDSMRDKVAGALANAKIEANEIADTIEANRKSLLIGTENDTSHLFPDFAAVCTKAREDFAALHAMRIQQEAVRKEDARKAEEARIAAAVEAERKAGEARAAAAVEAERQAEAKRVAEQEAADQRAKTSEATHGEPNATAIPQAPLASSPPTAEEKRAILVDAGDDVRAYLNTLDVSEKEFGRLRAVLMGYEQFKSQRALKVAA